MFGPYYAFEDASGVWYRGEVDDGVIYATAALDPNDWRAQLIEHRLNMGLPVGLPANHDAVAIRAVVKCMLNTAGITVPDDAEHPSKFTGMSESDPVTNKELKEKQPDKDEEQEEEEDLRRHPVGLAGWAGVA